MCIRDRVWEYVPGWVVFLVPSGVPDFEDVPVWVAVLYSADALDYVLDLSLIHI